MQMRAAIAGLRIAEIPVSYRLRIAGRSKVAGSLRGTLRAGTRIAQVLARVAIETRRQRPAEPASRALVRIDMIRASIDKTTGMNRGRSAAFPAGRPDATPTRAPRLVARAWRAVV
jgi:hypothetical protein